MDRKMDRFLSSIGIEGTLEDLSFIHCGWKDASKKCVLMSIRKEEPWNGDELSLFEEAIGKIGYEYEMSFSYGRPVSLSDVESLLADFFLSHYRTAPSFSLALAEGRTILCFPIGNKGTDDIAEAVASFQSLLDFLTYPFVLKKAMKSVEAPRNEEPLEEEEDGTEAGKEPFRHLERDDEEEKEYRESMASLTADYVRGVKEERAAMSVRRATRRGDYHHLDDISIIETMDGGNVEIEGEVYSAEIRPSKRGDFLLLGVGEGNGAVSVRATKSMSGLSDDEMKSFQPGDRVLVKGAVTISTYNFEHQISAHAIEKAPPKERRTDDEPVKRAELHVHTKMSAMDGVSDPSDYFKSAKAMGLDAIAFTDHGVVQAFPAVERAAKDSGVKPIYGCEFYMVDDPIYVFNPAPIPLTKARYCVFDFETTGLSSRFDHATEFGCVIVENGAVVKHFDTFIDPGVHIPDYITAKTHITDEMVRGYPREKEAVKVIDEVIKGTILVSHNAAFDVGFLNHMRSLAGLPPIDNPVVDTLALSHYLFPNAARHNLGSLSRNLKLDVYDTEKAHRADFDAEVLNNVWQVIISILSKGRSDLTHADLANLKGSNDAMYKHLKPVHLVALAKNQAGLKDLYRLVSLAHTKYLASGSMPKIPRFEVEKLRQNLLLGTACLNGEVFTAAWEKSAAEAASKLKFYDYLEVQPLGNYLPLVYQQMLTEEELKETVKGLISSADELGIPVVATSDAHYADPEEKIIRDIYIVQDGINKRAHPLNQHPGAKGPNDFEWKPNPDQHLRTTKEMLSEFIPLVGKEKAREIVIDNSRKIAAEIEPIKILKDRLYAPTSNLPGTDEKLRAIVKKTFDTRYGEHPDPILVERVNKELSGIIDNGYSVTYYIAHKLVQKAHDDGYIVGSRGSVGSSFVANLAGISEVNPLPPHYLCPKCKALIWNEDPKIRSGYDLPPKKCPHCGADMIPDGQNIPFETFLGFHAEKVPDIDLNFANDYQSRAFAYTRTLLSTPEENEKIARGEELDNPHVIRAGTIGEAKDKNCFGYVLRYYETVKHQETSRIPRPYVAYLAYKCTGVKRTTGQHPGGIVVIPADMDITDFTPFQHPADDPTSDWLTTHFEFKSMHDSVLKIDELGHLDPQALRMMSLLTGIDVTKIPMNDRKVISLFSSPDALKLRFNPLGFKTGSIALPEFGTDFVQQILDTVLPKSFDDLLIISGISHGTNVWHGNSEDYIKSGQATLQNVIGCRDDIMNFLIRKGVDASTSFKIMEDVRHGKGLKPDYEVQMKEHGVEQWYIDSCNKIQYLFPRAHAAAYVIAAVRVAYFKLYHPLEFYAVYFATRCDAFDLDGMCGGYQKCLAAYQRLDSQRGAVGDAALKERDFEVMKSLMASIEMYDRGYSIKAVNLYKSLAKEWAVDEGEKCIYAPFQAVPNLSEKAAQSVVEARKDGEFISVEDLQDRTALSTSDIDRLRGLGTLDGLGETNQLTLF